MATRTVGWPRTSARDIAGGIRDPGMAPGMEEDAAQRAAGHDPHLPPARVSRWLAVRRRDDPMMLAAVAREARCSENAIWR